MSAIPGCVITARFSGTDVSAWRCTSQVKAEDGQYGKSAGATATIRVRASLLPAGITIQDGERFAIVETVNGVESETHYRVNGLALTMGMYRFEQADDY